MSAFKPIYFNNKFISVSVNYQHAVSTALFVLNPNHYINCWSSLGFCASQCPQILVTDSNMKTEVEQAFNKNTQLQQLLDKAKRELQENQDQWVFVHYKKRQMCISNRKYNPVEFELYLSDIYFLSSEWCSCVWIERQRSLAYGSRRIS